MEERPKCLWTVAGWACLSCICLITFAGIARGADPADEPKEGHIALAVHVSNLAEALLRTKDSVSKQWDQATALLDAAEKLDPSNTRYAQLKIDAVSRGDDDDAQIDAIRAYLAKEPDDHVAQIALLDLYADRYETAQEKLDYLRPLIDRTGLSADVRSYVALRCGLLMQERGEMQEAADLVVQALKLNPSNLAALRLRYDWLGPDAPPIDRVSAMLALLQANPAQPWAITAVARELASAGLVQQALVWFNSGVTLGPRLGLPLERPFVVDYGSELLIADQRDGAAAIAQQLLTYDPQYTDGWFLKLILDRGTADSDKAGYDRTKQQARNALTNQLLVAREKSGGAAATTQPVESLQSAALPDLSGDVARLKDKAGSPEYVAFTTSVLDLAWFETYFAGQPDAAAPLVEVLHGLLGDGNDAVTRLQGWAYLVAGRTDEAKVKLSAIAARDPLAQLGMIRVAAADPANRAKVTEQVNRLMRENPAGLMGATLIEALRPFDARVTAGPAAAALLSQINYFPAEWLKVLDSPQNFYFMRVDPLQVGHAIDEPMLARITIQNSTNFDLTIGRDGVLKPDLWFDAQLRGIAQRNLTGVATDHLQKELVLHGHKAMSQVIRLDQGDLSQLLAQNPAISLQVNGSMMTNPLQTANGVSSAAAGYRVQFSKYMVRTAYPLLTGDSRQRYFTALDSTTTPAPDKIDDLNALALYVRLLNAPPSTQPAGATSQPSAPQAPGLKTVAVEMQRAVEKARNDSVASVAAWAGYTAAMLNPPERREQMARIMLDDERWEVRLLGLAVYDSLPSSPDLRPVSRKLLTDDQPAVREFAATVTVEPAPATTQSTTEPAEPTSQPTPEPATTQAELPAPTSAPTTAP